MAFPALAVAFQFSVKKGIWTFAAAAVIRQLTMFINDHEFLTIGGNPIEINQEGVALIVGMIFLLVFAVRVKADESSVDLAAMFSDRVKKIAAKSTDDSSA